MRCDAGAPPYLPGESQATMTYEAIIKDDRVEWVGERPDVPGPIKVTVTVLEDGHPKPKNPDREGLKEILEKLAELNPFSEIDDPVAWQRGIRKDRPLPGRED